MENGQWSVEEKKRIDSLREFMIAELREMSSEGDLSEMRFSWVQVKGEVLSFCYVVKFKNNKELYFSIDQHGCKKTMERLENEA